MANLEKHKKNPVQEWMEAEESTLPSQARSSHVIGAYVKIPKTAARKVRRLAVNSQAAKTEPALVREPAPPSKPEEKQTQANSLDHLRKLNRLPKLRARYQPRSARPGARG